MRALFATLVVVCGCGGDGEGPIDAAGGSDGPRDGSGSDGPIETIDGPPQVKSTLLQQLATGGDHTCARTATGAVRCWGRALYGQLGHGNTVSVGDDETAATGGDVDVGGAVAHVVAGEYHACALLTSGGVRCWGRGALGQLGYASSQAIGNDELPSSAGDVDIGGAVTQIAAGGDHTCALLTTGAVRCWGSAIGGQLGYENFDRVGDDEVPATAGDIDVGGPAVQIAAGGNHTCAVLATGAVRCWGYGNFGQLGYANGDSTDDRPPSLAGDIDVGGTVVQVAAGGDHTCALLTSGAVRCWGLGTDGQLGYGSPLIIGVNETPSAAGDVPLGDLAIQITAGYNHTCALLWRGAVRCWGAGFRGMLGYLSQDNIGDTETPATAGDIDVGGDVIEIAAGHNHTCARLDTGAVRCWGWGFEGRLGYGNVADIGDDEAPATAGDVPFE
jgi:alpha-tubulin suppressor-like RCC1 family protein